MAESEVAKIPRPKQMRGFLHSQIKRNLTLAILATIASGVAWRVFYANPRKQKYADFYKNYDGEAEFERMRKKGLFQSCSADDDDE